MHDHLTCQHWRPRVCCVCLLVSPQLFSLTPYLPTPPTLPTLPYPFLNHQISCVTALLSILNNCIGITKNLEPMTLLQQKMIIIGLAFSCLALSCCLFLTA